MPQNMTELSAPWRGARDQMTWTEEEVKRSGAGLGESAIPQVFYDFSQRLRTRFAYSIANGLERKFTAVPNPATMEAAGGAEPYSLFAFINDHPNTLFAGLAANGGTWTTVMQTSSTAAASLRHKNRMIGYDSDVPKPLDEARNMLHGLDSAMIRLTYTSPAASGFYKAPVKWEDSGWPTKVLFLSQAGMDRILMLLRGRNDVWSQPGAAGLTGVAYNGLEFCPLPRLDEVAIYQDSTTALVTEGASAADGRGPRIYVVDTDAFKVVFGMSPFLDLKDPRWQPNEPTTWTQWGIIQYNFVCAHRWTCAIITPGTVAGTFPSETLTAAQPYAAY